MIERPKFRTNELENFNELSSILLAGWKLEPDQARFLNQFTILFNDIREQGLSINVRTTKDGIIKEHEFKFFQPDIIEKKIKIFKRRHKEAEIEDCTLLGEIRPEIIEEISFSEK